MVPAEDIRDLLVPLSRYERLSDPTVILAHYQIVKDVFEKKYNSMFNGHDVAWDSRVQYSPCDVIVSKYSSVYTNRE